MAILTTVRLGALSTDSRLDTDYYHPSYLLQDDLLAKVPCEPLSAYASVSDGNHVSIAEDFREAGVRYLRGQDLSDFFVSDASPIFIPADVYKGLARSHMLTGDVLIGVVGSIGSVSLITDKYSQLTGNCKIAIARPNGKIPAEALAVWLSSKYGQNEIHRRARGSVQIGVILPDVRTILVPQFRNGCVKRVIELVEEAKRHHLENLAAYPDAEAEMLERIGWPQLAK
jgi:type I restriction enzyme S subunit